MFASQDNMLTAQQSAKLLSRRKWKDFHQENTWSKAQNIQFCETRSSGIILAIYMWALSQCFQAGNNSTYASLMKQDHKSFWMVLFSLYAWLQINLLQERHWKMEAAQGPAHGTQFKRAFCYVGPHLYAPILVWNGYLYEYLQCNGIKKYEKKKEKRAEQWGR